MLSQNLWFSEFEGSGTDVMWGQLMKTGRLDQKCILMQKQNIEWIIKLDDDLDLDLEQTMQNMSQNSEDSDKYIAISIGTLKHRSYQNLRCKIIIYNFQLDLSVIYSLIQYLF